MVFAVLLGRVPTAAGAAAPSPTTSTSARGRLRGPDEQRPVRRGEHPDDAQHACEPGADRTAATQRTRRSWRERGAATAGTVGSVAARACVGWSAGLNLMGAGPYTLVGTATIDEALLHRGPTAMQRTGRPVGLLMWRGRHAWVMSGFLATGDPRADGTGSRRRSSRTRSTRTDRRRLGTQSGAGEALTRQAARSPVRARAAARRLARPWRASTSSSCPTRFDVRAIPRSGSRNRGLRRPSGP